MTRWYGNVTNRIEENKMFCNEITVGTGMTEYHYSDRDAYEVVEVTDQKHIKVRKYDHKIKGEHYMGNNNWELISNPSNPVKTLTKRGNYWYWTTVITSDILESDDFSTRLWLATHGIDTEKLAKNGKITKYYRAKVSFGVADYYFDYEF